LGRGLGGLQYYFLINPADYLLPFRTEKLLADKKSEDSPGEELSQLSRKRKIAKLKL